MTPTTPTGDKRVDGRDSDLSKNYVNTDEFIGYRFGDFLLWYKPHTEVVFPRDKRLSRQKVLEQVPKESLIGIYYRLQVPYTEARMMDVIYSHPEYSRFIGKYSDGFLVIYLRLGDKLEDSSQAKVLNSLPTKEWLLKRKIEEVVILSGSHFPDKTKTSVHNHIVDIPRSVECMLEMKKRMENLGMKVSIPQSRNPDIDMVLLCTCTNLMTLGEPSGFSILGRRLHTEYKKRQKN